jgi:hypothetical protein
MDLSSRHRINLLSVLLSKEGLTDVINRFVGGRRQDGCGPENSFDDRGRDLPSSFSIGDLVVRNFLPKHS